MAALADENAVVQVEISHFVRRRTRNARHGLRVAGTER